MVCIAVIFVFHYFCITHYSHIPILLKVALNTTTLTHHAHDNGYVSFFAIGLGPSNYLNSATFYWRACAKPDKWAVMYFVVSIVSLSTILIFQIWNRSDNVIFLGFSFYHTPVLSLIATYNLICKSKSTCATSGAGIADLSGAQSLMGFVLLNI